MFTDTIYWLIIFPNIIHKRGGDHVTFVSEKCFYPFLLTITMFISSLINSYFVTVEHHATLVQLHLPPWRWCP
jgi:hypothetical protein